METLLYCERCAEPYHRRRSTSRALPSLFCSAMCEGREFGMPIDDWIRVRRAPNMAVLRELIKRQVKARSGAYAEFFREAREAGMMT